MKPVLFLIYNRKETANKVFESIKDYKPQKLYIAADGPKKDNDINLCIDVRNTILKKINWDCNVELLFRDQNLGCKRAVISAIDWFFEHEEEGIILEDDCLPNKSFFQYCEKMLDEFRDHPEVMHISGCNFFDQRIKSNNIFYSRFCFVWGWATWRESWKSYDVDLKFIESNNLRKFFLPYSNNDYHQLFYWEDLYKKLANNSLDTWDYQWMFSIWNKNGYSIIPPKNLIKNLGFSENALHTQNLSSPYSNMKQHEFNVKSVNKKIKVTYLIHELLIFYHNYLENFHLKNPNKKILKIERSFIKNLFSKNYSIKDKLYLIKQKIKKN